MKIGILILASLLMAANSHAWGPEPVVVEADVEDCWEYKAISDGEGGVIIWWYGGPPPGAQRISKHGELLWGSDGISLFGRPIGAGGITSDGTGGVIIVGVGWPDGTGVFAQRLGPEGRKKWEEGGVDLGIPGGVTVSAVPDGTGGAIVMVGPLPWGSEGDVYIQRVDGDSRVRWGSGGKYLGEAKGNLRLFPTGNGGAIAMVGFSKAWKVGADGRVSWEARGLKDGTLLPEPLPEPMFVLEGGYVKKLSPRLEPLWEVQIWESRRMFGKVSVEDGEGGAFVAWVDWNLYEADTRGQRMGGYVVHIGADGRKVWGPVRYADDVLELDWPRLLPDGKGGVFIAYQDLLAGNNERGIPSSAYLEHVDRRGQISWSLVLGKANNNNTPYLISDGRGGVIVSWVFEGRIYVQHVSAEGDVGANYTSVKTGMMEVPEEFRLEQNIPNPFNSLTLIPYSVPEGRQYSLKIYNSLGQKVRTLVEGRKCWGRQIAVWDGKDEKGRDVTSGVYVYELRAGRFKKTRKMILAR